MNSNREERLQMRQRGAATRKPKEVDFGFSFGGFGAAIDPPPASTAQQQQPPQPQSQPAGIVEPPAPAANVKPLPSSPTTRPLGSQEQAALQRTPGSARNARPARPSMFDIPDEDEEPPGSARRNKRRKIETPTKVSRKTSTGVDSKRDEGARLAEPRQDGATPTTSVTEKPGEVPAVPPALGQVEQQPSTEVPVSVPSMPHGESKTNGDSQPEVVEAPSQEAPQEAPEPAQPEAPAEVPVKRSPETTKAPQPQEAQETPTAETAAPETSPTQAPQAQPKRTTPPQDTKAKRKKRELPETQATAPETIETSQEQAPPPQEQQEPERTTPPRQAKRKKRESPVAQGTPAAEPAPAQEPEPQGEKRPSPPRQAKGKQRRRESQEDQVSPENIAVPETTEKTQEPTQEPTQPQPPENQEPAEEAPIPKPREKKQKGQLPASAQAPSDKGKSADKGKKPEERPVSDEPVRDQGKRGRRGREDKARNPFKDTTDGKPTKPVDRPQKQKDDATETLPQQPSPEMKATRKRAGRPKKTAQPEEEAEAEAEAEPAQPGPSAPTRGADPDDRAAEQETTEEPTQAPARRRRKPQSRGETVPVTVHRLANMPSLSGKPSTTSDTSSSEDESADELSTHQKTKLPNRGGVNQADVLNQICRETLEKTLTTLKNGIAEETNTARKAEWTRKKKVVETYGTELEGRLLEMSEMLDSNFVLGVQLKRAKREMMEMRSRLYHVRREREAIAVQMDIVRRKHGEEERARVARTEINNTLHSLELAVHRSQHRPEEEGSMSTSTAAGLEYLVRTVAEDVSSRGHGQGGLLRQIQSFNAELEAVARRLEG